MRGSAAALHRRAQQIVFFFFFFLAMLYITGSVTYCYGYDLSVYGTALPLIMEEWNLQRFM